MGLVPRQVAESDPAQFSCNGSSPSALPAADCKRRATGRSHTFSTQNKICITAYIDLFVRLCYLSDVMQNSRISLYLYACVCAMFRLR